MLIAADNPLQLVLKTNADNWHPPLCLACRVKVLLQLMETIFRSKDDEATQATAAAAQPSMHHLRMYFKVSYTTDSADTAGPWMLGS